MTEYWVKIDWNMAPITVGRFEDPIDGAESLTFMGHEVWRLGVRYPSFGITPTSFSHYVVASEYSGASKGYWNTTAPPLGFVQTGVEYVIYTSAIADYFEVGARTDPGAWIGGTLSGTIHDDGTNLDVPYSWTDWAWGKITVPNAPPPPPPPPPGSLFTEGKDDKNFNSLSSSDIAAIIAGSNVYDALGDDDKVTLPNRDKYDQSLGNGTTLGWREANLFAAGNGNDTITGGDGNDRIDGGTGHDTLVLNGRPSDYVMVDDVASGLTTITIDGKSDVISLFEDFDFGNPLSANPVSFKNAYQEMAKLAEAAYSDTAAVRSGWRPLHAHEVSLPIKSPSGSWTFGNGVFTASLPNGTAAAHIYTGNMNGQDVMALSFRGSDLDKADIDAWNATKITGYFSAFDPLLDAVRAYVRANGIDKVFVTGHSLGGALAQHFMAETDLGDSRYVASTFGSIGYASTRKDPRIVHFEHTDDIARKIVHPSTDYQGEIVRVSSEVGGSGYAGRVLEHRIGLYSETVDKFVLAERLMPSFMKDGPHRAGEPSQWAVGDNGNNSLSGDDDEKAHWDETLLGLRGNDRISGWNGNDTLNGGLGNDILMGGKGKDTFVFDLAPNKKTNFDTIRDFSFKDDSFRFENSVFKKLGKGSEDRPAKLNAKFFKVGSEAADYNDFIIYNSRNGIIYYDSDGSGAKKQVEVVKVTKNLKVTPEDFFVI
ncbi:hypothetical protein [Microvirga ossetica]|nr:hypothetical protein [Microvirga ossetica]